MSDEQTGRCAALEHKLDTEIRRALKVILDASKDSRQQIAEQLTVKLRRKISPSTLDAWIAGSKLPWRLPADAVPALCEILGNDTIQRLLLSDKLREALELGESTERVVGLLRKALKK